MAPKAGRGAGVKAKAIAARRVKNGRRDGRRATLALLNALADEVGAVAVQVDVKSAAAADVERTIRVLDARCQQQPALAARLRVAVEAWVANGGRLQVDLAPPPDLDSASVLFKHRVLQPDFQLRSRAFMVTYNARSLRPHHWQSFRTFVSSLKGRIGARAWAANLEESLHAAAAPGEHVYHCHAYFLWSDGVGIQRKAFTARLKVVCEGINDTLDVEGLCRGFLPRVEKLVACEAGRLSE